MELIKWDESHSVGIDIFDEEHEILVGYINNLQKSIDAEDGEKRVKDLFYELVDYAFVHFDHEEELFKDSDYPQSEQEAHIREHDNLKERLEEIKQKVSDGDVSSLSDDLMAYLVEWLVKHAQGVDIRYVPYLKAKMES